ncbi:MAG: RluA family pseudouridine synthase [Victivallaceae bacterium]
MPEFIISADLAGERLDRALTRLMSDASRSWLQKLIRDGRVRCDGLAVDSTRLAVREGMKLEVDLPAPLPELPVAEEFTFPVLFEDEAMLVIDKPAGVVVHPAAGNASGTVVNALLGRYPELMEELDESDHRPGIVHRLDKDTSGCLVIAKTPNAQFKLSQAFASREVEKRYLALLRGEMREARREVETLIGRHPVNRQKMAVVERNGKFAHSIFRKKGAGVCGKQLYTVAEVEILTGRTHQIRVHAAFLGYPVLGDETYGGVTAEFPAARQMLHAYTIELPHPVTGERMKFTAPVPDDMRRWLAT